VPVAARARGDSHPQAGIGQLGKQRCLLVPVLPRRERGNQGDVEVVRQVEEPVTLVFLKRPAQPDCAAVLIEVTHLGRFQLPDTGPHSSMTSNGST
jgi:hypothetical protein